MAKFCRFCSQQVAPNTQHFCHGRGLIGPGDLRDTYTIHPTVEDVVDAPVPEAAVEEAPGEKSGDDGEGTDEEGK